MTPHDRRRITAHQVTEAILDSLSLWSAEANAGDYQDQIDEYDEWGGLEQWEWTFQRIGSQQFRLHINGQEFDVRISKPQR